MPRHPSAALSSLITKIFLRYSFAYFPFLCEDLLPQALFFISESFTILLEVSYLSFYDCRDSKCAVTWT